MRRERIKADKAGGGKEGPHREHRRSIWKEKKAERPRISKEKQRPSII